MESTGGKVPLVIETEINNENDVQCQSQPLGSNKQSGKASADSHEEDGNGQESGVNKAGTDHNPGSDRYVPVLGTRGTQNSEENCNGRRSRSRQLSRRATTHNKLQKY